MIVEFGRDAHAARPRDAAITSIDIQITRIVGRFGMSQEFSPVSTQGVIEGFRATNSDVSASDADMVARWAAGRVWSKSAHWQSRL
jgi:predicted FMN-binding regulatory protein PaiB